MTENNKVYTKDSIESLDPLEFTRLKPGVYAGDTTYATQLLVEIVANAIDEHRLGHGNHIRVNIDKEIVEVIDNGQGFLVNELREDGKTVLEASFSVLNTSGKYREDGTYEGTSLGAYGIGSKITNFLSHWLEVFTVRENKYEKVTFEEGVFKDREVGFDADGDEPSGTIVKWQASEEFFDNPIVETRKVKELFKTLAALNPDLTIELNDNGDITVYHSENGIHDLVDDAVKDSEIIKSRFDLAFEEGKNKLDMVLTYTDSYSSTIIPYVNTGFTESGPHISQTKSLITREFNKFFKEVGWLAETDKNLSGDDIQEGMFVVFNITAPNIGYDAQVKSRVTKIDMKPFLSRVSESLASWLRRNEKDVKVIADKAIGARKAREAAKRARQRAREQGKKNAAQKFQTKLADCYSKDRMRCELYVVEGDSAAGTLKMARDNEFQAVLPVRGKILNVQKASLDQILKNAEIMTMIQAFGLEIDFENLSITFDPKKLRYGKIIIMSDADVDGMHIKNLFYTFIWNFCPDLITEGYIYAGYPPLYKISTSKGIVFLRDDKALSEYTEENKGKKYQIGRMKGLGEMNDEDVEKTLLNREERIIKQVIITDEDETYEWFEGLMGSDIDFRKKFLAENSQEVDYAKF